MNFVSLKKTKHPVKHHFSKTKPSVLVFYFAWHLNLKNKIGSQNQNLKLSESRAKDLSSNNPSACVFFICF